MYKFKRTLSLIAVFCMLFTAFAPAMAATSMQRGAVKKTFTVGDVTLDDKINTGDAVMQLRSIAGIVEMTMLEKLVSDFNGDCGITQADIDTLTAKEVTDRVSINTGDAVALLRHCAGFGGELKCFDIWVYEVIYIDGLDNGQADLPRVEFYLEGDTVTVIVPFAREGYEFLGWTALVGLESDRLYMPGDTFEMANFGVVFMSNWEQGEEPIPEPEPTGEYTVTYFSGLDEEIAVPEAETVEAGTEYTIPEMIPEYEGMEFIGWLPLPERHHGHGDNGFGFEDDFEFLMPGDTFTMPPCNLILVAMWEADFDEPIDPPVEPTGEFTITYMGGLDEEIAVPEAETVMAGTEYTIPEMIPEYEGLEFIGWLPMPADRHHGHGFDGGYGEGDDCDFGGGFGFGFEFLMPGDTFTMPPCNLILVAMWEADFDEPIDPPVEPTGEFTITYMGGLDEEIAVPEAETVEAGTEYTIPEMIPEYEGMEFIGWLPMPADRHHGNGHGFDGGYGEGDDCDFGGGFGFGFEFLMPGDTFTMPPCNLILVAMWEADFDEPIDPPVEPTGEFTITYMGGLDEEIAVPEAETVEAGTEYTIPEMIPEYEGMEFMGWLPLPERHHGHGHGGNGFGFEDDFEFLMPGDTFTMPPCNLILVAMWEADFDEPIDPPVEPTGEFTITYMGGLDEEIAVPEAETVEAGAEYTIPEMIPEYEGLEFIGWLPMPERHPGHGNGYGHELLMPGDTFMMPPCNLTLVAMWERAEDNNEYTVTFMNDFGFGVPEQITVTAGEEFIMPEAPEAPAWGGEFQGWVAMMGLEEGVVYMPGDTFIMPECDVVFVAVWGGDFGGFPEWPGHGGFAFYDNATYQTL